MLLFLYTFKKFKYYGGMSDEKENYAKGYSCAITSVGIVPVVQYDTNERHRRAE